jgi:hypothetical protein
MFHLILTGIALVSGDPEPTRAVYDTLHIAFEKNTDNILDHSRESIYSVNPEILRALTFKVYIPDYSSGRELSLINQQRIKEIEDLLLEEGAHFEFLETNRVGEQREQKKLKLDPDQFAIIVRYLPIKYKHSRSINNPECQRDTLIQMARGELLRMPFCDYISFDSIPEISLQTKKSFISEIRNDEIDVLKNLNFKNFGNENQNVLIPFKEKVSDKELILEKYQDDTQCWMKLNSNQISNEKLNGLNYFSLHIKKSGNYRISRVPKKSKMELILAPEKSAIIEAFVMRDDSLMYPVEIVMGGKAIVVSHEGDQTEYSILARFISERGVESEIVNIPMKACFNKTFSTKKWEGNNQLRPYFHGHLPSVAGSITLIDKTNMYVSR